MKYYLFSFWFLSFSLSSVCFVFVSQSWFFLSHSRPSVSFFVSLSCFLLFLVSLTLFRPFRLCLTIVLLSLSFSFVRLVYCLTILLPPLFSLSHSLPPVSTLSHYRAHVSLFLVRPPCSLSHYPVSFWFYSHSISFVRFGFVSTSFSCLSHSRSSFLFFVSLPCFLLVLVSLTLVCPFCFCLTIVLLSLLETLSFLFLV
jgi:hypothetical protein